MVRLARSSLALAAALLAPAALAPAQTEKADVVALMAPPDFAALRARDARLGFTGVGGEQALALAEDLAASPSERAVALIGVGSADLRGRRERLEAIARQAGDPHVRGAALLALGVLSNARMDRVAAHVGDPERIVAESALVALVASDAPLGRAIAYRIAGDPDHPRQALAERAVRSFEPEPPEDPLPQVLVLYHQRFEAAKRWGLIDGQRWSVLLLDALRSDPAFLDQLVLRAIEPLRLPGVKDHVLGMLRESGGEPVVRAAVRQMPVELSQLYTGGFWEPASLAEWAAMLDEIERSGNVAQTFDLLQEALEHPEARKPAARILLRHGWIDAFEHLEPDLRSASAEDRRILIAALGASKSRGFAIELERAASDSDPSVRAASLVARLRLGVLTAHEDVRLSLRGEGLIARAPVVAELCRHPHDPRVQPWLEQALTAATGGEHLRVSLALAVAGRSSTRAILRDALDSGRAGDLAVEVVRALAKGADERDLALFRELFPDELRPDLNVELASALLRHSDPLGLSLLRDAIWTAPWHRSVLASGVVVQVQGIQGLHDLLASPPPRASESDLRRLGFALGEWGGLDEVEALAQRRPSGDPALQGAYLGALAARTH